ncbi:MAG: sugar ABC transporter substrate-binding protein [Paracoccaceae bacterium]|nr:sugar ABC transporter substrate-binding protein [Paracoccaceae bacterium]
MKSIKLLTVGAAMLAGSVISAQATELHFIMCGGEIRQADQTVVDAFVAKHDGVSVNIEAVPWGTCQDKSLTLAAAGDPPSIAYMGSRTLRQLANNGLIVSAQISDDVIGAYQPGILNTVTVKGTHWGYPRAFSTKALFINCGLVEEAGEQCVAPHTWTGMYNLAKAINDNTEAAGVGLAAKDFDNTMHQFLNYLYSNGGVVIDTETGENMLDSDATRETLAFFGKLVDVAQDGPTAWERSQLKDLYNDGKIGMYIDGPWGRGQHNAGIKEITVPIPAGPNGDNGTILITDSIAVFKGSGHEDLAHELAGMLTTGESQYALDTEWGLTPIFDYEKLGFDNPYYKGDAYWQVFVNGIGAGGPEPLVEDFKSLQAVFTNMIQGIVLKDDTVDNLVTIAGEELDEAL